MYSCVATARGVLQLADAAHGLARQTGHRHGVHDEAAGGGDAQDGAQAPLEPTPTCPLRMFPTKKAPGGLKGFPDKPSTKGSNPSHQSKPPIKDLMKEAQISIGKPVCRFLVERIGTNLKSTRGMIGKMGSNEKLGHLVFAAGC